MSEGGWGSSVGLVWGDLIYLGLFRVSTQENSHVRQTPNDPQTNAKTSACGAGTYSGEAASTCTTCGTGKYSGAEGATAESTCNKCQAGTFSEVEGAFMCQGKCFFWRENLNFCWFGCFRGLGTGGGCLRGEGSGVGLVQGDLFCSWAKHNSTHTYIKPQITNK